MSLLNAALAGCVPLGILLLYWVRSRLAAHPGRFPRFLPPRCGLERADLLCLGLLAMVLVGLLHASLLSGAGLVPVDALARFVPWRHEAFEGSRNWLLVDQYLNWLPQKQFFHEQLMGGDLPLWNPHLACGVPFLASMQHSSLFPIHLLLAPLDPFAASGPAALIKLFLAGAFTYAYCRRLRISRHGALLSGLAFALSGFMIVWLGHPHVNSAVWLPLLFFLIEGRFRPDLQERKGRLIWPGFAVAYACVALGGHAPTIVHVSLGTAAYVAFRTTTGWTDPERNRRLTGFACSVLAGLLLAAPQLLPFLEYVGHSSLSDTVASEVRAESHLPLPALVSFLLPFIAGAPTLDFDQLREAFPSVAEKNFNERTGYFGALALFLALAAVVLRRDRMVAFHAMLALACLLVAFGVPPLPSIVAWLPVLDSMNYMRLTLLVGFAGSVLAGIGLDHLPVASTREKGLVVGSAWLLVGGLFAWSGSVLGPTLEDVEGTLEWVLEQWLVLLSAAALLSLLAVARARPTVRALCVLGLALDLSWFAKDYNPSIDRAQYYPSTPGIELLRRDSDVFRVMALGRVLPPNSGMPYGLSDVRGQDFMTIRRYEELLTGEAGDFFFLDWVSSLLPIHRFLNVKYVVGMPDAELTPPHFERIYHDEMSIFRVHPFVERALIVRDPELVEGREAALARARSQGLGMSDSLVLESPPSPTALRPRPAPQADSISVAELAPDRLTVEAALTEPGFVLLLDTHFPGWKAFSDDVRLPIERANYAFRAVGLPAGTWTLEFEYRPVSFSLGVMVALSTALWLLSILVVNRIEDRSR